MAEKKIDSTSPGMTSSSSHLPSMYGNDFLELVWQNGQILVQGGSQSRTRKSPSSIGYPINKAYDEGPCITKRARLSTSYSLLDFPDHKDSHLDASHQNFQVQQHSYHQFDLQYTKSKSFSKLGDVCTNPNSQKRDLGSKLIGVAGNSQLCTSSLQQSSNPNSQKQVLGSDQRTGKVNFSNFLRPAVFFKSSYQGKSATQWTNSGVLARPVEERKALAGKDEKAADNSVVIDSAANKGSHSVTGFEEQTSLTASKVKPVAKSQETVPDEHSIMNQTSNLGEHRAKGKPAADCFYNEPLVASSSLCSLGASNDPTLYSRKHEDTDDSTYTSDNDEEPEDVVVKETSAREGSRVKRSRNAEIHNLSEGKRRDKINKKMRALKDLIPNCNKMDKASMLDDAIEYLKNLKLQLQVMSMGSGLCMPLMMLPGGAHLPQLMNMRAGMGIPCGLPQFPIPQMPMPAGITDNRLQMLAAFPNQMLPIPPVIPMPPKLSSSTTSTQPHPHLPTNNSHLDTH